MSHSLLRSIQEKNGATYDSEDWMERLSQIGCVVEGSDEESIEIEVFPDRPDLLSHETMARAARAFLDGYNQKPTIETVGFWLYPSRNCLLYTSDAADE